jgi:outer membrane protein TolC
LAPQPGKPAPVYSLHDCIQLALERNPDILKAQKQIESTQGLIIQAKSTLYPQVSMNGRLELRNDDLFDQGGDPTQQSFRDFWVVQVIATQSLYSGGINRNQISIANLQHQTSILQFQATIDNVLKLVKYGVYAVIVNKAKIKAQQESIDLLTKNEDQQKALFDAGKTTRFNVLRVQVDIGNQRSVLYQAEDTLTSSQIALAQLLNIPWPKKADPDNPPFTVAENLDCPTVGDIKVEEFINLAMRRRPELQSLDKQIQIAETQIKIDKAALVPRFDGYVSDLAQRDQSVSSFDQSVNQYAVGILGTWNIFDGYLSKGKTVTDTASLGTAHISRDQVGLEIQSEVRDAYARLLTAQQTLQAQIANVQTAEESVKLSHLSADNGYATLLDVLQATQALTTARTEELETRQLYLDALADLEKAISLKFVDWPKDGVVTTNSTPTSPAPTVPPPHTTPGGALR